MTTETVITIEPNFKHNHRGAHNYVELIKKIIKWSEKLNGSFPSGKNNDIQIQKTENIILHFKQIRLGIPIPF